jgi:hypothetical protein
MNSEKPIDKKEQRKESYRKNLEKIKNNKLPCNKCRKNFDNILCYFLRKHEINGFCSHFESIEEESNFLTPPQHF